MISEHHPQGSMRVLVHPRTLRKARENVKQMVNTGASLRQTRSYLHHFAIWWSKTVEIWRYEEILAAFASACFDLTPAAIAAGLLQRRGVTLWSTNSELAARIAA
jgi:hypothetical protein